MTQETQQPIFPEKEIISLMKYAYNLFGSDGIPFDTIDALTDYFIQVRLEEDKEFKLALGNGYYL
jgi:hypothetical protein